MQQLQRFPIDMYHWMRKQSRMSMILTSVWDSSPSQYHERNCSHYPWHSMTKMPRLSPLPSSNDANIITYMTEALLSENHFPLLLPRIIPIDRDGHATITQYNFQTPHDESEQFRELWVTRADVCDNDGSSSPKEEDEFVSKYRLLGTCQGLHYCLASIY